MNYPTLDRGAFALLYLVSIPIFFVALLFTIIAGLDREWLSRDLE